MRMRARWACTASAASLRRVPEASRCVAQGSLFRSRGVLVPGLKLVEYQTPPFLYSPRHDVSVSRKSCTKPPCYCGKSAVIDREEPSDIKFWCLHINNRPRHEKFSCELFTNAQRQDKFSVISAFSDIKSSHQTWKVFLMNNFRRWSIIFLFSA